MDGDQLSLIPVKFLSIAPDRKAYANRFSGGPEAAELLFYPFFFGIGKQIGQMLPSDISPIQTSQRPAGPFDPSGFVQLQNDIFGIPVDGSELIRQGQHFFSDADQFVHIDKGEHQALDLIFLGPVR